MTHLPSITVLADQLFAALEEHMLQGGHLTDEHMAQLSTLLGKNWAKALQVVDQNAIFCFTGEGSGRAVYQVHGRSGRYITLPRHYCSCQAYFYEVVGKAEAPYCKHQLAARLAKLLSRCTVTTVPDATLANILMQG